METADLVASLLDAAASDREHLPTLVDKVAQDQREPLAAEMRRAGQTAAESGDWVTGEVAMSIAAMIDAADGRHAEAVEAMITQADFVKVAADTVDRYDYARNMALASVGVARTLQRPDLMFPGMVVACDSAYFAADLLETQGALDENRQWLLLGLDDCLGALDLLEFGLGTPRGVQFVSLLTALVAEIEPLPWFDEESAHVQSALRRIALATESLIGPDVIVPDEGVQAHFAERMAMLSYSHGSPDSGRQRLDQQVAHARDAADLSEVMRASATRYAGERQAYRSEVDMRALRADFWDGIDELRSSYRSRAGRLWTAQELDEVTGTMIADAFAFPRPDLDEAFRAMECNRARTLLDEIDGACRPLPERAEAAALEAGILHLEAARTGPDDELAHEMRLVSRLPIGGLGAMPERVEQLGRLEQLYTATGAGFAGAATHVGLDDVIAALREGEALIEYHIPYDALDPAGLLLVLLVTPRGALRLHLPLHSETPAGFEGRIQVDGRQPLDASALGELILNTRSSILSDDRDGAYARLAALHGVLIAPLMDVGFDPAEVDRLVVVPHGILHAVPFAALRAPDGRFLIEDTAVVLAPSASVWHRLQARPSVRPQSMLGFADPALGGAYDPLPDARRELEQISELLDGVSVTGRVGADATESALRRDATGPTLLHFATHGEFPEEDVMNMHRLLLAPGDGHDGAVNAEELRELALGAVQLAVLSICDGGVYRFGPGDEPYGLVSALLAAGAGGVVGPMWPIDDRLGRMLTVQFYRRLIDSGPGEALRQAALVAMQGGAAVRDWAGFVLVGPGRAFT